jgi:hypothetical protein
MLLTPKDAGQINIFGPGKNQEAETQLCAHCQRLMIIRASSPDMKPYYGEVCRKCMKRICPLCLGKSCVPFMRQIEKMEARDRMLRNILNV